MPDSELTPPHQSELLGTLLAYRMVQQASWPQLNAVPDDAQASWPGMTAAELQAELERLVLETQHPGKEVRVFWKMGEDFVYRGCNDQFARDAGFEAASELVGKNDFLPGIRWERQSYKYRRDDRDVVSRGVPMLDIIERQDSPAGTVWLRTGKAPICTSDGDAIGLLGMYEVIDPATAKQLSRRT